MPAGKKIFKLGSDYNGAAAGIGRNANTKIGVFSYIRYISVCRRHPCRCYFRAIIISEAEIKLSKNGATGGKDFWSPQYKDKNYEEKS
jgi:hypothetical protein